ncbi:MAG: FGGY-family carbohydrate kinase [Mediterraneibacter gnavus]
MWVQIFADVLQIPVEVMEDKELGAMGAAITAGIAGWSIPRLWRGDQKNSTNKENGISKK